MDIKQYFVTSNTSVREAIKIIEATGKKVVFIVDVQERLKGIFTDGDIRRYILRNGDFTAPVSEAMNKEPVVFHEDEEVKLHEYMKTSNMLVFPIVNDEGQLVRAVFWDKQEGISAADMLTDNIPVVIMAGGKGTRLYPYTKILPKPLIPIGEIPIVEHIINRFKKYSCNNFYLVVNYKKNMIKAYFNEIEKSYNLNFVDEDKFLGTGGGLYLLKDRIDSTFILSNCDVIIEANYGSMYRYHKKQKNLITVVCAMKNISVPYGVIKLDEKGTIAGMTEKPELSFLTNTGLYIIEPEVIDSIKPGTFIHMPEIVQQYLEKGENVGVYPISEKEWLDMGQLEEMENMIKVLEEK